MFFQICEASPFPPCVVSSVGAKSETDESAHENGFARIADSSSSPNGCETRVTDPVKEEKLGVDKMRGPNFETKVAEPTNEGKKKEEDGVNEVPTRETTSVGHNLATKALGVSSSTPEQRTPGPQVEVPALESLMSEAGVGHRQSGGEVLAEKCQGPWLPTELVGEAGNSDERDGDQCRGLQLASSPSQDTAPHRVWCDSRPSACPPEPRHIDSTNSPASLHGFAEANAIKSEVAGYDYVGK